MKKRLFERLSDVRNKNYITPLSEDNKLENYMNYCGVVEVSGPLPEEEIIDIKKLQQF